MEGESKYLLFAGDDYYPSGGIRDLRGYYSSIEEAQKWGQAEEWAQIAILKDGKIVLLKSWHHTDGPDRLGMWRDG